MSGQCPEMMWDGRHHRRCTREVKTNGHCGIHDPERRKRREEARRAAEADAARPGVEAAKRLTAALALLGCDERAYKQFRSRDTIEISIKAAHVLADAIEKRNR